MKRTKCIDKRTLIKAFSNEISNDEKIKLLDHTAICPDCLREFNALKELWIKKKDLINDLERVEHNLENRAQLKKVAREEIWKIKLQRKAVKGPFHFDKRILAGASGAFLLVAIISAFLLLKGPQQLSIERKPPQLGIELLAPRGQTNEFPLLFKWNPLEGAKRYSLEILNRGLETVYLTENIERESFALPEEVFKGFKGGETYFWKITAATDSNEKVESDFGRFTITSK